MLRNTAIFRPSAPDSAGDRAAVAERRQPALPDRPDREVRAAVFQPPPLDRRHYPGPMGGISLYFSTLPELDSMRLAISNREASSKIRPLHAAELRTLNSNLAASSCANPDVRASVLQRAAERPGAEAQPS